MGSGMVAEKKSGTFCLDEEEGFFSRLRGAGIVVSIEGGVGKAGFV